METHTELKNNGQNKRREAEHMLAKEVKQLMQRTEEEGLTWTGSHRDLMEALHVAYTTGRITDSEGTGLSFTCIVSKACRVLHLPRPRNPYSCAQRGRQRKGVYRRSFMERYEWMLFSAGTTAPLHACIAS